MCRVLNKHHAGIPAGAVYIGRGSKWGNPFRVGRDGDRTTVIVKYERWLVDQHHLLRALDELVTASAMALSGLDATRLLRVTQARAAFTGGTRTAEMRLHLSALEPLLPSEAVARLRTLIDAVEQGVSKQAAATRAEALGQA